MSNIHRSLLDAVRMAFLHSSRPKGRVSQRLAAAADARFVGIQNGHGDGTTRLVFHVPTFESVAPDAFAQQTFWESGPRPDDTAFEAFGAALSAVASRNADSSSFDPAMLREIRRYRRALNRGVHRIAMPENAEDSRGWIDSTVLDAATELSNLTPEPRRVRIAGKVDVMGASQALLKVDVSSSEVVTAIWEGPENVVELHNWFGRDVVLEGLGVFRPSGSLLRIDVDAIREATANDGFFRRVPRASVQVDYGRKVRVRPGERSPYSEIKGLLADDESDEEFERSLSSLR